MNSWMWVMLRVHQESMETCADLDPAVFASDARVHGKIKRITPIFLRWGLLYLRGSRQYSQPASVPQMAFTRSEVFQ